MRFWDASALVPLVVQEPMTRTVSDLISADPDFVVWALSSVEVTSALIRRAGGDAQQLRDASPLVAALESMWRTITDLQAVSDRARYVLSHHPLRAADALQLGAALVAANDRPETLPFVTLDRRLAVAARAEGFAVYPTNL